ncbi:MAG: bacterioferritin [Anaerolineales bacterium]|nr:bacterioferritin [Anaerolineales bacterium]
MKGNPKIFAALNMLLADELTSISQYMVHSETCANWGYDKLHAAIEKRAIDEMHHAEWLIARLILLEGAPVVSKLNPIKIGANVVDMAKNDLEAELVAIKGYNESIGVAHEVADQATVDLLTKILKDEENHAHWSEVQLAQVAQMGLESYLSMQSSGASA